MKSIVHLIFFFTSLFRISAQTVEASSTVKKNILQIEIESLHATVENGDEKITSWSIPNTLFRFGLTNNLELQLNIPFRREETFVQNTLQQSLHEFDHVQIGVSTNLWKQKKIIPEASIMIRTFAPMAHGFQPENLGHMASLNFKNDLTKGLSLNYNIGYVVEPQENANYFYIANFSYIPNERIHFFIENFAEMTPREFVESNLNMGGGYNIKDNISIDLSYTRGLNYSMECFCAILCWGIKTK